MRYKESCGEWRARRGLFRGDEASGDSPWTPSVQIWSVSLRFGARRRDQKRSLPYCFRFQPPWCSPRHTCTLFTDQVIEQKSNHKRAARRS